MHLLVSVFWLVKIYGLNQFLCLRLEIDEEGSLHFYMLTVNPNIKANPHLANSCSDSELKSRAHLIDAKTYQSFFIS